MSLHHNPRVVTSGMTFLMDAADANCYPGSGTTIYDLTGNGYNATLHGTAAASNGWFDLGSATDTSNYITIDKDALNGLTSWTIELWLYMHAYNAIDTFLTCGAGNDFLWFFDSGTTINFQNTGGSTVSYTTSVTTPFLFTAKGTGGSFALYKNGDYVTGFSNTTTITVNSTIGIVLGQEQDSNSTSFDAAQKFRGKYGPVRFYNRALSSAEIIQNYEAQKHRFGL